MEEENRLLVPAWYGALVCFILAGSTGALIRFSFLYGFPVGLVYVNIRHAHSHLMYFGWVTPVLMALIASGLARRAGFHYTRRFAIVIGATLACALLAYPLFLLYGYSATQVGAAHLPLSVFASTLNILAWYGFAYLYWRSARGIHRDTTLRLWDGAVVFLLLASLGAWGRAVLVALKSQDAFLNTAMVHLFLDLFSYGWFILALLGQATSVLPEARLGNRLRLERVANALLFAGLPLTFLLGVPVDFVPPWLRALAGAGGLAAAGGLLLYCFMLLPLLSKTQWRVPVGMLWVFAFFILILSIRPLAVWGERMGLRILYLHTLLLGVVTLGLFASVAAAWGRRLVRGWRGIMVAVLLLLASLIPLTNLLPSALTGRWAIILAARVALTPVLAGIYVLTGWGSRARSKVRIDPPIP